MEARGKQDLWVQQKPEVLAVLREQAIVQSVESSNRIEGVTVEAGRLRPLVLGGATPKDRPEEELAGYRAALDWVYARDPRVAIAPGVVLKLHALAQGGSTSDAGVWKRRDNEIIEILPSGDRSVRFVPVPARETAQAVQTLCRAYQAALDDGQVPVLLVIATFVFDLLCIHPFRDGNGRVSRLMTSLLLQSNGFQVARFVSLERLIEESREEYYHVLKACSVDWHEGRNQLVPWWNFFLGRLRAAYQEFEEHVEQARGRVPKADLVRRAVLAQMEPFTLAALAAQVPAASVPLIKIVLGAMKKEGLVRLSGRGRGAEWTVVRG
ncbi:Fic family protein [Paludibaculum fermentans]|uniref:Fic family protein n=1 Tax=Paludibaculum fermentans TaxID=1473598 RepID=A0A7S7SJZ6_PALFE|nr:Fic family protein [Paludibaculum fermentans]QOY87774.1 Fic family protein [Paludibaculum fermentans]